MCEFVKWPEMYSIHCDVRRANHQYKKGRPMLLFLSEHARLRDLPWISNRLEMPLSEFLTCDCGLFNYFDKLAIDLVRRTPPMTERGQVNCAIKKQPIPRFGRSDCYCRFVEHRRYFSRLPECDRQFQIGLFGRLRRRQVQPYGGA